MALLNNIILSYKHFKMPRTVFYTACSVFFAALVLCIPLEGKAWAADTSYTVEDIEVDVTADNAVEAREKAFEEAQVKGYGMLAERFLSAEEMETFEAPDIDTVSALVQDYEVTNEQLSMVRYKGVYKIRYSARSFAGDNSAKEAGNDIDSPQEGLFVLPFYELGGRFVLWQSNPFMEALHRAKRNNELGRFIIPTGDAQDVAQIRDGAGVNYNPARLNAMRIRYRAKQAVVLIATPEIVYGGTENVLVRIYAVKPYGSELASQVSVIRHAGEMQDQFYNRIIMAVSEKMGAGWKRQTAVATNQSSQTPSQQTQAPIVNSGAESAITASLKFSSVREWVETKNALERARGVKSIQVQSLFPRQAQISIRFYGDVQNLRNALLQVGVRMNDPMTQFSQAGSGGKPVYQLFLARSARQH